MTRGVTLTSIQCLRGIAALLVVLSHALRSAGATFHGQSSALYGFFHLRDAAIFRSTAQKTLAVAAMTS